MKTASFSQRAGIILLLSGLVGFIIVLSMKIPAESDFFQHLAHGDDFFANPQLTADDHWSYVANGGQWVRWTFLYALLLSLTYAILKIPGIWFLQMTALLVLAFLLWKFRRKVGLKPAESALIIGIIFAAMQFRYNYRAENFAYIFFAVILRWLFIFLKTGTKPGYHFILFLALWQLFQNSVYLGLVPFAIYCLLTWYKSRQPRIWAFFLITLAILTFAHIDTYHLHVRFWQGYEFHKYFTVEELSPPLKREHVFFWVIIAVAVIGFLHSIADLRKRITRRPAFFFQLSCFVFFGLAAISAARAIPFALIAGMPFIFRGTGIIFRSAVGLRLLYALLGIALLVFGFFRFGYTDISPGTRLSARFHPEKVCDFILQENPPGHMYHPVYSAGYFLWRFKGNPPVMFDYRLELYLDFVRKYRASLQDTANAEKFLSAYGITYAVESRHEPRHPAFSEWQLVYQDDAHEIRMNPACINCAEFLRAHLIVKPVTP